MFILIWSNLANLLVIVIEIWRNYVSGSLKLTLTSFSKLLLMVLESILSPESNHYRIIKISNPMFKPSNSWHLIVGRFKLKLK